MYVEHPVFIAPSNENARVCDQLSSLPTVIEQEFGFLAKFLRILYAILKAL